MLRHSVEVLTKQPTGTVGVGVLQDGEGCTKPEVTFVERPPDPLPASAPSAMVVASQSSPAPSAPLKLAPIFNLRRTADRQTATHRGESQLQSAMREDGRRWQSLRLALISLLFYSNVFLIKASMFACKWVDKPMFLGLNFKTCLALAQTLGYAAGKVPSILYSPKLPHSRVRGALIAVMVTSGTCICISCATPPAASLALVGTTGSNPKPSA